MVMRTLRDGLIGRVAIAVVGPDDLVERVMVAGNQDPDAVSDWQLVAAGYRQEQETPELLARLQYRVDACLFTGPLPYDIARQRGALTVPGTFVPLNDAALYRTLLKGVTDGVCEVDRISIDTVTQEEVEQAYAEIAVPIQHVRVHPYKGPEPAADIAAFHERLWRAGDVSAAVTCIRSVWQRLQVSGVPALRVLPTQVSVLTALRTAALMGVGRQLADSQIAVAIVESPATRAATREQPMNYWREELKLGLHQLLLREARSMDATLQPFEDHGFMLVTTVGALASSTDGFRVAPFLDRAREELGVGIHVGVGVGGSARDAAAGAGEALAKVRELGSQGFALHHQGELVVLSGQRSEPAQQPVPPTEGRELLARLAQALDSSRSNGGGQPHVLDADEAARLLGITPRSARRVLGMLTDEGLAWPLPPERSLQRGRPRHRYRLVVERLPSQGKGRS